MVSLVEIVRTALMGVGLHYAEDATRARATILRECAAHPRAAWSPELTRASLDAIVSVDVVMATAGLDKFGPLFAFASSFEPCDVPARMVLWLQRGSSDRRRVLDRFAIPP